MTNVVEANIEVMSYDPANILSAMTSVKRLTLRGITYSTCQYALPVGTVFSSLVYLEILTYNEAEWLTLLMRVLKDSPNLRALKLVQLHYENDDEDDDRPCWSEPSSVPECVKWSLETLEWTGYDGAEELKEVIAFILRNANRLKRATIHNSSEYHISEKSTDPNKKLEMLKELSSLPRCSPTCQLAFD
ncbi:FBD domain [Arabidopsis thaliana x Arabidopsis arenosa]|uniref:FBD domain n=1 Tax=Arabidopsis thaliana x Arabidopsis arenosa TaxID=1240361 RepID=A0A8T2ARJ8_9BRAS|nr:FBD domain [Arabidopsis thaliana x Arabidopsis arenosa]